jgi:hypothetical protein
VVYVSKGRISPIYLADVVVEVGLIAGWLAENRGRNASTGVTKSPDRREV